MPSHLIQVPFDHVILEDRQSFAAILMCSSPTQKSTPHKVFCQPSSTGVGQLSNNDYTLILQYMIN